MSIAAVAAVADVVPLIRDRRSSVAFAPGPIAPAKLAAAFEAARWAASAFNEQPWRFVVAVRQDREAFERLLRTLAPPNQRWAQHAGALVLTVARTDRGGVPNRHAFHDLGLATAQLVLQAHGSGLHAHIMGGFDAAAVRAALALPDGFEPVAVVALGEPGEPAQLPDELRARETHARQRRALDETVFAGRFGEPARIAVDD